MGALLLAPLCLAAGWFAGAAAARQVVRRELERNKPTAPTPAAVPPKEAAAPDGPPAAEEELSPETIMILSAAVAAVLGKKARIRSARLMPSTPSTAWAQQGRASIQASHHLGYARHGR
jgi:methylmalonyl-CoA carboxyltransferase large subunit